MSDSPPKLTLAETLDRVPLRDLEAAVVRRRNKGALAPYLFKISAATGISIDALLSRSRAQPDVAARHQLYQSLYRAGYNVTTIANMTGHERTRITHALKNLPA